MRESIVIENFQKLIYKSSMETTPTGKMIHKNWIKRTVTATVLILGFIWIIYIGIPALLMSALTIQVKCFQEIITIAYNHKKLSKTTLNWYFLFVVNYFFSGEVFRQYFEAYIKKYSTLEICFLYHRFISFCFYFAGIIWFMYLLRKKLIREQFTLLAWTHFLCIIIVLQSYMVVQNMFEGIIWLVLPMTLVFFNDIFSYIFGKLLGKTPLIQLSPNKTLEGFLGGAISTIILGQVMAYTLCQVNYLVCPTKFVSADNTIKMVTKCNPSPIFKPTRYNFGMLQLDLYPFLWHVFILTLFASVIAPFGGFCASGFKRAFEMKNFGNTIPGHGGMMDRFDCQYLMATFVNVYIISFIKNYTVEKIFAKVLYLKDNDQLEFYNILLKDLKSKKLLDI